MSPRFHLGVPEGSPLIDVLGVKLAVSREGQGPPLVCLHAIAHGGRDFEALTDAVKDRFEVIRVDWPGQGRSGEDPDHPAGAARYADLLTALLDRLGVERPILVGASIGGAAAILHAARRPVRGLVLCDSGGLVAVDAMARGFTGALAGFFAAGARGAWWFPAAYGLLYRLILPSPAAHAQRARIVAAGRDLAPLLAQAWTGFGRPEADIRAVAAALERPVWVAWAKSDHLVPLGFCRPAIAAMRHASLTVFPGGHAPFLEQPRAFVEGLEAFVAGLEPDAPALRLAG